VVDRTAKERNVQAENADEDRSMSMGIFVPPDVDDEPPPTLDDLAKFKPEGAYEDRLPLTVAKWIKRATETLANAASTARWKVSMNAVAVWALKRGLVRLMGIEEVQEVCKAREALLAAGSEGIMQLDRWPYQISAQDEGTERLFLRSITRADAGRCAEYARGLGLSTSTFGALALMAGLVDAPLPGELPELLVTELRAFRRRLQKRAVLAVDLRRRAPASPQTERRTKWRDVMED
jgi:hypothetical protein